MATLGDLMIRVGAEIDGFTTAMKSVIDQVDDMGDQVSAKLESIADVGGRLVMVGGN
jgi:flagellar biosynthesis/type III secretory pathway ATPase